MNSTGHPKSKLAIIGLDGATLDVIAPLVASGKLPTLKKIMSEGVSGNLRSTIHPSTPQAWSTFITGTNAGKHGVFDFRVRNKDNYVFELANGGKRDGKSFWSILSDSGYDVGVVNVPFTFPPEEVNGYMIPGFDAPRLNGKYSYPEGIYEEIVSNVGRYELKGTFPIGQSVQNFDLDFVDNVIKNRYDVASYLMSNKPWDLFMMVFNETDHMQHLFWKHWTRYLNGSNDELSKKYGPVLEYTYESIDRYLKKIVDALPADTYLMIMSDHGGGELKKVVNLNKLLFDHGLLKYRDSKSSGGGLMVKVARKLRYYLKRYLSESLVDRFKHLFKSAVDQAESFAQFGDIDWSATKAFSHGTYGNISINLVGREPHGIVAESEYDAIRATVKQILLGLKDPDTSEEVVTEVCYKEDIYHGDNLEFAPDILIRWKDYAYFTKASSERDKKTIFEDVLYIDSSDFQHTGTHREDGVFMLSGPGIKKGLTYDLAQISDLAPTILHLFGQAIPSNMDGKVLENIFTSEYNAEHHVVFGRSHSKESTNASNIYNEEEEEAIKDRLSSLGYLE